MQGKADLLGLVRSGHVGQFQQNLAARGIAPRHIGQPFRLLADDMLDHHIDRQIGQRCRYHMLAVPQNRRAVRDAGNLVHPVADIDDRHALGALGPDAQPVSTAADA